MVGRYVQAPLAQLENLGGSKRCSSCSVSLGVTPELCGRSLRGRSGSAQSTMTQNTRHIHLGPVCTISGLDSCNPMHSILLPHSSADTPARSVRARF